jgi:predicted DNA-binding protein (UPF0251 family)
VKRATSARVLTPATIIPLPAALLIDLSEQDALIRARIIRIGLQRLLSALEQQHEQLRIYPDLLLADWLVELSVDIGIVEGNRVRFPHAMSQNDIAADLGVSRETISRRLNEWERSGLLLTGSRSQRIEILDYQRVSRLASLRVSRSRQTLQRTIDDIDAAIAAGDLVRARNIGLDILRYYPSSPELHHRIAIAAARSGDVPGALEFLARSGLPMDKGLSSLQEIVHRARTNPFLSMERIVDDPWVEDGYGVDEIDRVDDSGNEQDAKKENQLVEDLAALHARLLKEEAFRESREAERRSKALASFRSYRALFNQTHNNYPGINAATMALIAGDENASRRIAQGLIASVDIDVERYWSIATLAEALLICGKRSKALDVLLRARSMIDADAGAKASTIVQLRRLATVIPDDIEPLVEALGQRTVVMVSGHMFRGSEMDGPQQREMEESIKARGSEIFHEQSVGYVYGALACGSDIILAEAALKLGLEFNVVLPFGTERFVKTSVRIGDPLGEAGKWEKRFYEILGRANAVTVMEASEPADRDLDSYFFYALRYAAGTALQRATILQTRCELVIVSDQKQPDNIAGANQVWSDWRARDRPLHLIPYNHIRRQHPGRQNVSRSFRPVIFLWEVKTPGNSKQATFHQLFNLVGTHFHCVNRTHRDGRQGICLIMESIEQAFNVGLAAVEWAARTKPLRVICDFGLVVSADLSPDKKLIPRLQAADDLPGFPIGCLLATEAFAMQAKFELGEQVILVPVGRAEAPGDASQTGYLRSSFPVYRATDHSHVASG